MRTMVAGGLEMKTEAERRKEHPVATGVLDYFPDALLEVAAVSLAGNRQHNLGALRWDKSKSTDEADALMRHLIDRGTRDTDGMRHSAKVAWRALALLQRELDKEKEIASQPTSQDGEVDVHRGANEGVQGLQLPGVLRRGRVFGSPSLEGIQPRTNGHGRPSFGVGSLEASLGGSGEVLSSGYPSPSLAQADGEGGD